MQQKSMTGLMREMMREQAYIGGRWVQAGSNAYTAVTDPATGECIGGVPNLPAEYIDGSIDAAVNAFDSWRRTSVVERADRLLAWYEGMRANHESLAHLMTWEQGKPLDEARGEVQYAASFIRWFAEEGRRTTGVTIPPDDPSKVIGTIAEPVGVVAVITPWNFPLAMITRKVAAALAAGCTTLVCPAMETPFSALALAALAEEAGLDNGEFNVVTADGKLFSERVCADTRVRGLSFTGSTHVGKQLLHQCADTVKRVSMELGGNAPLIVCDDVDIEMAVASALAAKFQSSGQDCLAANRIFVHRSRYEAFLDLFVERMNAMRVGNGFDEDNDIGPLIHAEAVEKALALIDDARDNGARIIGREQGEAPGKQFLMPTVVADLTTEMRLFSEEVFAPVAAMCPFDDDDSVIDAANDTEFGLAAYVYTRDQHRMQRFLRGLDYGVVGINTMDVTGPHVPFGGVKQSGLGREGAHEGIAEYLEPKYYCIGSVQQAVGG